MEISVVFESILLITIMIILGTLLSKSFPFNEHTRKIFITIIVNIAMPCIILSSIFKVEMNKDTFKMIALTFFLSVAINIIGMGIGWLLASIFYRHTNKTKEIALLSGLGNTGFIGIPLCATLLGPKGALFAAIFDAGVDLTIWTIGVLILQKNVRFTFRTLKSMINIPTISILLGLLFAYFNFRPPQLFIQLTGQLAALASPLAMFYIGMLITTLRRPKLQETGPQIWLPITVKLLFLPMVVALFITFFHFKMEIRQTVLIQSMMPTLTLASILFAKYSADEDMGAITTVFSTILALSTIPLMIYLFSLFTVF